jgi:transcriptional antiterminator Rof (Rho-off)
MENTFPSTRTNILPGPMGRAQDRKAQYTPVDCDFTDELEFVAVRKIPVTVSHWDEEDRLVKSEGLVADIQTTASKEEFLVMKSGEKIRLDHIFELRITG